MLHSTYRGGRGWVGSGAEVAGGEGAGWGRLDSGHMRVLVISDIHANLHALEAVLAAAGTVDEVWDLGDVVGYGAFPNEVRRHDARAGEAECARQS